MKTEKRGGARQGAGRPVVENKARNRTVKMTDEDWGKFRALGAMKWLRDLLQKS